MAEPRTIRVFLTLPNVLATGIVEIQADVYDEGSKSCALVPSELVGLEKGEHVAMSGEGDLWHRYRSSANRRAREMRKVAIELLEAKIDALNGLDFGASTGGFRG